jgi:hypothetical protein
MRCRALRRIMFIVAIPILVLAIGTAETMPSPSISQLGTIIPSNVTQASEVLIYLCGRANSKKTCMWKCQNPYSGEWGYCLWVCPPYVHGKCRNEGWRGTSPGPWYYYY